MAFKLDSSKKNPLKSKGFLNQSPFKANGNTMAYANGEPGDPPEKTEKQKEADAKAKKEAKANMKVVRTETNKVDGGVETIEYLEGEGKGKTFAEAGVDPAKAKAYWDDNPDKYEEYLANKKLTDQNITFVPDDKPEPSEKITYTTSETPRPKPKAQDYITGEGDKVFGAVSGFRAEKLSGGLSQLMGKRKDVRLFGQKKNISKKDMADQKAAYDAKVLASRANKGRYGAEHLTIAEQEAKENINQLGAGKSSIGDTKTGVGQTSKNQTFRNDRQGNMQIQTLNKRNKVIKSESTSPENDIVPKEKNKAVNASTFDGRDVVVETKGFNSKV